MSGNADWTASGESVGTDDGVLPSIVEGYEDFVRVGRGGFSSVYSARQIRMGRPVAIKVLEADLTADDHRRAFERECQAMGVLSRHPNIATVYSDEYTIDGRPCLVMELYHGNYRDRLSDSGPLPLGEFLALGVKIAGALQAAHDTGILHRDIKPHNIFLSDFGEPALGDFGISTIGGERSITDAPALSVAYSAPEVIDDGVADYLSDVYSLAATLHHLLAGASPFAAPHMGGVVKRIMSEDPDPVNRTDVPESLHALLRAGLSKRPSDRPDSAGDFAWSLQEVQAELGFDRTAVPLQRADRFDPDVGADWANSSGESSSRRRAMTRETKGAVGAKRVAPPGPEDDAEATLPPSHVAAAPPAVDPSANAETVARSSGSTVVSESTPKVTEPTIRRTSAAFESLNTRPPPESPTAASSTTESSTTEVASSDRRRGWGIDVVIWVAVVALFAFALFRLL